MEIKKFFCILLIHKSGKRGYIYENAQKKCEVSPTFIEQCVSFESIEEVSKYIRLHKLNNWRGWNAHIRDEKDIEKQLLKDSRKGQGYYRIVNEMGQSAFYDTTKKRYHWKATEEGCTAWENKISAENFIVKMKTYFPEMRFSAMPMAD